MNLFGRELELLRKRSGFTQYKLAQELGMSRSYINRIESGERKANIDILKKISEIMTLDSYNKNKLLVLAGFEMEIDKNTSGFKTCFRLALEFKRRDMLNEAQKVIQFGMNFFENMIELHVLQANMNLIHHNYDDAIKKNEQTLNLFEKLKKDAQKKLGITKAEVIHNLGYVYFEKALQEIYKYEELLIKNNLKLKDELVKNEIILNLDKATEYIEKSYEIEPNNLHILDQLARLYYRKGEIHQDFYREEYFKKSIEYYDKLISFNDSNEILKKQEATIFLALALGKINKLDEAIRLINSVIIFNNLYYLGYYAKSCIYAINSKNNIDLLEKSYLSLEEAIKLNPDLKENIFLEIDLYNLYSNKEYKRKLEILCIKKGNE